MAIQQTKFERFPVDSTPKTLSLQHVNLSPVLVKMDFVHQLIDQVNAAPVLRMDVLTLAGIGKLGGI